MPNFFDLYKFIILPALIVVVLQAAMLSGSSAVSTQPTVSGITVSPAFITAQVGSAQRQAIASVGVRNNFTVPITVTAVLNGFDIRNNSLLPTNRSESALADIIKFTPAETTIPPQSSRNIAVTVIDKPSLSPGGHYVSLLITQSSAVGANTTPQLSLKPAVSVTIYVIKEDGAVRSLQAQEIKPNGNLFSLPNSVDVTFANDGNVASVPRGVLTIRRGASETTLAQSVVNQNSVPLYPQQSATLRANFVGLAKPKLPGRFVTTLDYRPDGQNQTKSVSVIVWYFPVFSLLIILIIGALVGLMTWSKSRQKFIKMGRKWHKPKRKSFVPPDLNKISNTPKKVLKSDSQKTRYIDIK